MSADVLKGTEVDKIANPEGEQDEEEERSNLEQLERVLFTDQHRRQKQTTENESAQRQISSPSVAHPSLQHEEQLSQPFGKSHAEPALICSAIQPAVGLGQRKIFIVRICSCEVN